jgi:cytochrome b involved in lipid metabolism
VCTYSCCEVYRNILVVNMTQSKLLSVSEISKHNSDADCWIVVDGQVWDITGFAPDHPGGPGSQSRVYGRVLPLPT